MFPECPLSLPSLIVESPYLILGCAKGINMNIQFFFISFCIRGHLMKKINLFYLYAQALGGIRGSQGAGPGLVKVWEKRDLLLDLTFLVIESDFKKKC